MEQTAMEYFRRSVILSVLVFLACFIFSEKAYAYLDPGTGSYILQLILAGLLGALFMVKTYWRNIKSFIFNIFSRRGKGQKRQ